MCRSIDEKAGLRRDYGGPDTRVIRISPCLSSGRLALNASPQNSAATTDDAAEYDITIINTGDEDLTVTLSASQDSDCNGFTLSLIHI